jgi:hypothetical protein
MRCGSGCCRVDQTPAPVAFGDPLGIVCANAFALTAVALIGCHSRRRGICTPLLSVVSESAHRHVTTPPRRGMPRVDIRSSS